MSDRAQKVMVDSMLMVIAAGLWVMLAYVVYVSVFGR
jgi:hypothetical protein